MILKLGVKHQGMKLYKVYINHDPGMTFLWQGQHRLSHAYEWGKVLKCHLKGKTCRKWANELEIEDSEQNLDPRVVFSPTPWQYTCI